MFGFGRDLEILEAKFQIYEDLSKEMLDKLERAVDKISESNQQVALILERHENRLEQNDRNDNAIMELIRDVKDRIEKMDADTGLSVIEQEAYKRMVYMLIDEAEERA